MKKYSVLFFALFAAINAFAHPHSFLDMKNKVLINQEKLEGFEFSWWLDEITSSELIYEIRSAANKDDAIKKMTAEMDQSAVDNGYFSELYNADDQKLTFNDQPLNSSVEIQDNRVVYHFTLALAEPLSLKGQVLRFYTFEPSYYLSMAYEKAEDVTSSEQNICQIKMEEPKVNQDLRLYASKLDKTDTPDLPPNSLSLGAQFAQKVSIVCE